MSNTLPGIEHVVVAMMENRSFDNLLGWLYADNNQPKAMIPTDQPIGFEGLTPEKYFNEYDGQKIYASCGTRGDEKRMPMTLPNPDPNEHFEHIHEQIFGRGEEGAAGTADMSGFLSDYASIDEAADVAEQIMQCYSPEQVPVISALARNFAVCDHWYASVPAQTWPNRGFMHCGTSCDYVNNEIFKPYDTRSIFNVLQDHRVPWGVFSDIAMPNTALTMLQFLPQHKALAESFRSFKTFKSLCASSPDAPDQARLPSYSFVEPCFQFYEGTIPNDFHPPHNVARGDQFLGELYNSVRGSPYRDKILLLILFDEHGGCYDHVPPPGKARPPSSVSLARHHNFSFDRFGVRVPAIALSSYIKPGTVFRSNTSTPYDHTSVLATLRDWKQLDRRGGPDFLDSERIAEAPTLDQLLTLRQPRDWPELPETQGADSTDEDSNTPINDLQLGILIGIANQMRSGKSLDDEQVGAVKKAFRVYGDLLDWKHVVLPVLKKIAAVGD